MRNTWRILVMVLAAVALLGDMAVAGAEHPKADEYRKILRSGKFYLEYSAVMDYGDERNNKKQNNENKSILVFDGDRRASYTYGSRVGDQVVRSHLGGQQSPFYRKLKDETPPVGLSDVARVSNGFGLFGTLGGSKRNKLRPDVFYLNGNRYYFCGKNKAFRVLSDDAVKRWPLQKDPISLPQEFSALLPERLGDEFFSNRSEYEKAHPKLAAAMGEGWTPPVVSEWLESGDKELFGQKLRFDRYVVRIGRGSDVGISPDMKMPDPIYEFYYDTVGALRYIRKIQKFPSAHEAQQAARQKMWEQMGIMSSGTPGDNYIRIDKLSSEIPAGMFSFPQGCKVYEIEAGTINDLLGEPMLVEQH